MDLKSLSKKYSNAPTDGGRLLKEIESKLNYFMEQEQLYKVQYEKILDSYSKMTTKVKDCLEDFALYYRLIMEGEEKC